MFKYVQKMSQVPPFQPTGGHYYVCSVCNTAVDTQREPAKCKVCTAQFEHLKAAHRRHIKTHQNYWHVERRFLTWAVSPWQNPGHQYGVNPVFARWRQKHPYGTYQEWNAKQSRPPAPNDPPKEWLNSTSGLSLEQWQDTPDHLAHHLNHDFLLVQAVNPNINFKQWLTHRHS